jgi:hypothetical protein
VVDEVVRLRVPKGISISEVQERLMDVGLISIEKKWMFCEEWISRIYKVYELKDLVNYSSSAVRVNVVTEEMERIGRSDLLVVGMHVAIGERGTWSAFGFPFLMPVFAEENWGIVKSKIRERLSVTEEVVLGVGEVHATNKDDVMLVKDDDMAVEQFERYVRPAICLIYPERARERKTVHFRQREIPIKIRN